MPVAQAARRSATVSPQMRSNASAVTRFDGIAPAQTEGTSVQPRSAAACAKPPIERLPPPSCSSIFGPRR